VIFIPVIIDERTVPRANLLAKKFWLDAKEGRLP